MNQHYEKNIEEINLGFFLNLITHNQNNYLKKELQLSNINYSEFIFIICICQHKTCSQSHIAKDLNVSEAYVTKIINKLEKKDIIERNINPNKKSEKLINITEKGNNIYLKIEDINKKWEKKVSKNLTKEEIKNLKTSLFKICIETVK